MAKEDVIEAEGVVKKVLPATMYLHCSASA